MERVSRSVGMGFLLVALIGARLAHAQGPGDSDWPAYNRTLEGARYSPLGEISASNVAGLREICSLDLGDGRAFQTGPLVMDGTIYLTTDTMTLAIDGTTCRIKWKNTREYAPASYLGSNRGAAYLDGRLFRGSGDAHVYAVEAGTGKTVWDVAIGDAKKGESTPMAPIAWDGVVYAGVGGGDNFGVTGRVYALSPADGHVLWKFDTIPDTKEVRATWGKTSPAGAGVWTSLSLDRAAGVLYVPAGNPGPDFVKQLRPGQNLLQYGRSPARGDRRRNALEDLAVGDEERSRRGLGTAVTARLPQPPARYDTTDTHRVAGSHMTRIAVIPGKYPLQCSREPKHCSRHVNSSRNMREGSGAILQRSTDGPPAVLRHRTHKEEQP